MLRNTALAILLASPFVDAQRFRFSQTGCLLDQSEQIADKISCGRESTVTFAVEWYGADLEQLQSWLVVAGCSKEEARHEAVWVSDRCQARSESVAANSQPSNELRDLRRSRSRRSTPEPIALSDLKRADDDDADDDVNNKNDSDIAPTSTYNPYVITVASSVVTCMTKTSITTKVCTSSMAGHKYQTSCTTYPTEKPTCVPGMNCAFATDTGLLSCYQKEDIPTYGLIILGIIGLAVAFMFFAVCSTCCADRRRTRSRREAAEGARLLAASIAENKKRSTAVSVAVQDLGAQQGSLKGKAPAASVGDTVPLMAPEYQHVQGTTGSEHGIGSYDPFSDAARRQ